jgi:hypothetical protein
MNTSPNNNYLIHVYMDKDHKRYLYGIPNQAKNRKQAVKIMREEMHKDLVRGTYYFYVVTEQRNTIIDFAPNHETTD